MKGSILTQFYSVAAVNIEWLIAFVDFPNRGIENQTIRAQPFSDTSIVTFIEFVALDGILVLPILTGAFELLCV